MATIFYTATSLDGFLADPDDGLDFLDRCGEHEDTYTPFIAGVGAICMGSATYEFILRAVEDWPCMQPTWVFTSRDLPKRPGADVRFVTGPVDAVHADMIAAAESAGKPDVWVCGGGDLAGQFYDEGLLDELVITVASWTLADGKPLFPRSLSRPLRLLAARRLGDGFAELRYGT